MIVRASGQSIVLITQPDHAALARRIMEHCTPLLAAPRRASILLAIGEHDNGWQEPDSEPTVDDEGRVIDFIRASNHLKQSVWPRAVARLADDPFAAALVAQHAVTVYDRFRADRGWQSFFPQVEALRDWHTERARATAADVLREYAYVRVGDLISLTFCNGWTDAQTYGDWTVRLATDDRVTVTPWRFDRDEFAIAVPGRRLRASPFRSTAEFLEALRHSPEGTLTGAVVSST
jgi:Protein of unknown function (DUF3891)